MKIEELLTECTRITNRNKLTNREIDLICEWKKRYSDQEIIKAVKKAVLKKARHPISGYSTKILVENRMRLDEDQQQVLRIAALENWIKEREKRYE